MSSVKDTLKWTNEITLKFIELYQNKPMLWDPKNQNYYNKFMKHDAWEELASEMKISLDDCKQKIMSLQSSFRRERSKIKKSHGTGTGN